MQAMGQGAQRQDAIQVDLDIQVALPGAIPDNGWRVVLLLQPPYDILKEPCLQSGRPKVGSTVSKQRPWPLLIMWVFTLPMPGVPVTSTCFRWVMMSNNCP